MKNALLFLLLAAAGLFLYLAFAAAGPEAPQRSRNGRRPQDAIRGVLNSQQSVGENTSRALEAMEFDK